MSGILRRARRPGLAMLVLTVAGCSTADEIEGQARALNSGFGVSGLPAGLACGTSYTNAFNVSVEIETCLGARTLFNEAAPNFNNRSIGDRGLPSGRGFFTQASRGSGQATDANSDRVRVLPGTTCGFKETCNNFGELCLGHDPKIDCPWGWLQHISGDRLAPSGCNFAWCSYLDLNHVCCDGDVCDPACVSNMPQGTTCGLGDFAKDDGECRANDVLSVGCPSGFHRTADSYDYGRPLGNGLFWCTKN